MQWMARNLNKLFLGFWSYSLPCFTFKINTGSLHGDSVMACLIVKYVRSLNNLQHANLADHGLCVDLAHVVARVITLDIPDV